MNPSPHTPTTYQISTADDGYQFNPSSVETTPLISPSSREFPFPALRTRRYDIDTDDVMSPKYQQEASPGSALPDQSSLRAAAAPQTLQGAPESSKPTKSLWQLIIKYVLHLKFLILIGITIALLVAYTLQPYHRDQVFVLSAGEPKVIPLDDTNKFVYCHAAFDRDHTQKPPITASESVANHIVLTLVLDEKDVDYVHDFAFAEEDDLRVEVVLKKPRGRKAHLRIEHTYDDPLIFHGILVQSSSFLVQYRYALGFTMLALFYIALILDLFPRAITAIVAATVAILVEGLVHIKPTMADIMGQYVDWDTVIHIFSFMVVVWITKSTGIFPWFAVQAHRITRGKIEWMGLVLVVFTCITASLIDTTTFILLMVPLVIQICQLTNSDDTPLVLMLLFYANIASATSALTTEFLFLVNYSGVRSRGGDFIECQLIMLPAGILVALVLYLPLRFIFRDGFVTNETEKLKLIRRRRLIRIWNTLLRRLSHAQDEEKGIREKIQKNIHSLESALTDADLSDRELVETVAGQEDVLDPNKPVRVNNKSRLLRCLIVFLGICVLFGLQSFMPWMHLEFAFIAFAGAVLLFLSTSTDVTEHTFEQGIEWNTLIYFAALFAFMASLARIGLFRYVGDVLISVLTKLPEHLQSWFTLISVYLFSTVCSLLIDNMALAAFMAPIVVNISDRIPGLPIQYLIVALHMGSTIGGAGTIIGSSQNVLCVDLLRASEREVYFVKFALQNALPILVSTVIILGYLLGVFALFGRN